MRQSSGALNTTPYHPTPAGCRMPAPQQAEHRVSRRALASPLPARPRQERQNRPAPPPQSLGATGAGRHTRTVRIVAVAAIILAAFSLGNLVYHVIFKPTELFFVVGNRLDKEPAETWRQYGPLFRTYSTGTITPELLAALAQVESTGNPVDAHLTGAGGSP